MYVYSTSVLRSMRLTVKYVQVEIEQLRKKLADVEMKNARTTHDVRRSGFLIDYSSGLTQRFRG